MRGLGQAFAQTEASGGTDFVRLPAGGYVCRIVKVTDHADEAKPYLHIVYDIAEGEYANYYSDEWGKENEWAHDMRQYYTPAAYGIFKGFLKAVDISNGADFEGAAENGFDEQMFLNCLVGLIIGEEEYESNDGSVKTRLRVRGTRPAQNIREGKFKAPELKKLPVSDEPLPISEDEFPF